MTVHERAADAVGHAGPPGRPGSALPGRAAPAACATCRAVAEAFAGVDTLAQEVLLPSGPPPFEAALASG